MQTRLGRWCHATAVEYTHVCDWQRKVDMANADNAGHSSPLDAADTALPEDAQAR